MAYLRGTLLPSLALILLGLLLGLALRPGPVAADPPAQVGVDQRLTALEQRVGVLEGFAFDAADAILANQAEIADLQARVAALEAAAVP